MLDLTEMPNSKYSDQYYDEGLKEWITTIHIGMYSVNNLGGKTKYRRPLTVKPKENIVWIVKEKASGEHVEYAVTRNEGRILKSNHQYYKGFNYKALVLVKGVVTEIK
jgi:hypothetical protein